MIINENGKDREATKAEIAELQRAQANLAENPVPEAFAPVSRRQFFQGLAERDKITWDEAELVVVGGVPATFAAAINQMTADPLERRRYRTLVAGAASFERDNVLIEGIGTNYFGWGPAEIDEFFRYAVTL